MPSKWFICPDEKLTTISQCLNSGCRMADKFPAGRCLTLRTLRLIADERPWTGKPSTTQLLKGTRETFLEITTDYAINPQDAIFRVMGTKGHNVLEQYTGNNELGEERLHDEFSSGQFDFYDNGVLCDTKTSGSYKVMKALGYYQVEVKTGEIFKSGERKGQLKTRKEWREGGHKDRLDWAIQMNDYRMKLEACGFPVNQMVIESLARDGGTFMARNRGITFNGILIPINRISDRWVRVYMQRKSEALTEALEKNEIPSKCNKRETWSGRKCEKYCNVREICKKNEGGYQFECTPKIDEHSKPA